MPFPFIPLVGLAVSGSLVALGVKATQKRRRESDKEKHKTFAKYAQEHRVREKAEKLFVELETLKEEVIKCELSRFEDIFENILHSGMGWHKEPFDKADLSPIIASAPLSEVNALTGGFEWSFSAIKELQKQLRATNEKMKEIVLKSGFDFNKYTYLEKGIVLRGANIATNLDQALKISLVDEHGNFRLKSIDEVEELVTDTFDKAA